MNFTKLLLCAAISVFWSQTASLAETINITVPAGKSSVIYNFASYNPGTCGAMAPPKAEVRKPKNGTLTSSRSSQKIAAGKPCAGKIVKGTRVIYRPKPGFRGKDVAKFGFSRPRFTDGTGSSYYGVTANITVK